MIIKEVEKKIKDMNNGEGVFLDMNGDGVALVCKASSGVEAKVKR